MRECEYDCIGADGVVDLQMDNSVYKFNVASVLGHEATSRVQLELRNGSRFWQNNTSGENWATLGGNGRIKIVSYDSEINTVGYQYLGAHGNGRATMDLIRSTNLVGLGSSIGLNDGSTGIVNMADSLMVVTNFLNIGVRGYGVVNATNSSITVGDREYIGFTNGSCGNLELDCSTNTIGYDFYGGTALIAGGGAGRDTSIHLQNNSLLEYDDGTVALIGHNAGCAHVTVESGSVFQGGRMTLGNEGGSGDIALNNGQLILEDKLDINCSSNEVCTVSLANGSLLQQVKGGDTVDHELKIGVYGPASLTLTNSTVEANGCLFIGYRSTGRLSMNNSTGRVGCEMLYWALSSRYWDCDDV